MARSLSNNSNINFLNIKSGFLSWIFTLDHKRIAIMYSVSIAVFFLIGGLFGVLLRLELLQDRIPNATDTSYFLSANHYNEAFTLHGAIMIFLVIIPSIPSTLGNFLLPLMIGAKDVAFPKLNLLSYYLYICGALFLIMTIVYGGLDTGWTFYTPYSVETKTSTTLAVTGVFILGFSNVLTGLNFIVTVHKLRAPGLIWFRLPLFVWAIYSTAIIQILATPVLAITLFLLAMERLIGVGIFDPSLGGDPILFQNFFWFYSHPAVYIMILPAFGIISELVTAHSRKCIFGYKAVALTSIAIAILSFFVWGHHMFTSGQSPLSSVIFSLLTYSVAIPTAIKIFSWVATLYKGSIQFTAPMLYVFIFLILFLIGGLTGAFLGALSVDVQLHNTYFLVAHFHYVMMGGAIMAWIGGIYHWWSKLTGKKYSEYYAKLACIIIFIGFNLTYFPQFIMGSRGMPRRYYDYMPDFQYYHNISSIGSFILSIGLFLVLFNWLHSIFFAEPEANANPWNLKSLEWSEETVVPIKENFKKQPIVTYNPYEFDK
ncbi:cytochrome c oxidase subunit I [Silvanigrella aquatica]|uniref:Cytochrome c oxidase subunit I n=1 Tax=Silvanigrella aquatica TaxID=1915309 RepID=A0A1L4D3J3_9BACT|nr:cbb3-type cytochrome c oxidase subunit I [Silvanigrella aquatica]APJ04783.1 cytochrome c oxidase subunit I [Silvanigrella aquatica]